MFVNMYRFGIILSVFVLIQHSEASAIPMWEYLSKQEKMSFLYSMFATQVENFCDSSNVPNCNQELLKYGLNKLKQLPEEYLDSMDPYQRGGSLIIWDTMMAGHPLANTTPKPRATTTPKPNSYEDEPYSDFEFGSQGSASARIDNVVIIPAPKHVLNLYNVQTTRYPQQVGSVLNAIGTQKKGPYTRFQEYYSETRTTTERTPVDPMNEGTYKDAPLTGPMVVRVYLDGTPVEDSMPLPQDEDLKQYKMSQIKIPNI
ncbi:rhythmically expressed gene 5 protein [Diorhabda sublineata]|uniref:rhythmically expressed gene 5 protein n=1 Tax=Diorhabda sublineata TaxID=1163346 RepID=UPI0024E0452B|nr:rhythmically expressed gene 5 protein [Diorhabda sublineata]